MKFLTQILQEADCSCGHDAMPEGERNFRALHKIKKWQDYNGNGEDVFDAENIKKDHSEEPATREEDEQEETFKQWNNIKEDLSFIDKLKAIIHEFSPDYYEHPERKKHITLDDYNHERKRIAKDGPDNETRVHNLIKAALDAKRDHYKDPQVSFNEATTGYGATIPPIPAERIPVVAKRRNYAHDFSANRVFKLMRGANGRFRWRRNPAAAIVFFGKQEHERYPET